MNNALRNRRKNLTSAAVVAKLTDQPEVHVPDEWRSWGRIAIHVKGMMYLGHITQYTVQKFLNSPAGINSRGDTSRRTGHFEELNYAIGRYVVRVLRNGYLVYFKSFKRRKDAKAHGYEVHKYYVARSQGKVGVHRNKKYEPDLDVVTDATGGIYAVIHDRQAPR